MKRTLLIVAHPHFEDSVSTKTIAHYFENCDEINSEQLKVRNLIGLYPSYQINKQAEQEALLWAETIVLQFPFYWYSVPGLLKTWIDEVLEYGFAYGKTGDKLKGKHLLLSFSTGGPQEAYTQGGRNNFEITELLHPLKQTSNLIGTTWVEPIVSFSMANIAGIDTNKTNTVQKATEHAQKLYKRIIEL